MERPADGRPVCLSRQCRGWRSRSLLRPVRAPDRELAAFYPTASPPGAPRSHERPDDRAYPHHRPRSAQREQLVLSTPLTYESRWTCVDGVNGVERCYKEEGRPADALRRHRPSRCPIVEASSRALVFASLNSPNSSKASPTHDTVTGVKRAAGRTPFTRVLLVPQQAGQDAPGDTRTRLCCVLCAKALEQKERSWHKVACRSRPTHKGVTP